MVRNLRSGLRQSLKPSVAGGLGDNDIFTTASLDLNFAKYKNLGPVDATTGTNLIDFTRASSGTYVGSDGLIKTAVTNLLLQSEDFSTTWFNFDSSVSVNAAIAPDGKLTADKLFATGGSASHDVVQTFDVVSGQVYTFTCYLKAAERTEYRLAFRVASLWPGSTNQIVQFDLNDGTYSVTSGSSTAEITFVENGWYRCSITSTAAASGQAQVRIQGSFDADGEGVYLWGAQLEQSSTVGEYIKTTSTINSAPRFDHDPTTGESLGLLVEELRNNLIADSSLTTIGATYGASISSTTETNPEGISFCRRLLSDAGLSPNGHRIRVVYSSANAITVSAFVKKDTHRYVYIGFGGNVNSFTALFDIDPAVTGNRLLGQGGNGTYTNINAGYQNFPNGWVRIWAVGTTSGTDGTTIGLSPNDSTYNITNWNAAGTEAIFIHGVQYEDNVTFPSSYIPTTGTAATRAADVASISGSNFSGWYRQDEGTVFSEANFTNTVSYNTVFNITDGTGSERIRTIQWNDGWSNRILSYTSSGVNQANFVGTAVTGKTKNTGAYKVNDFAAVQDGGAVQTDTSGTVSTSVNSMDLGSTSGAFVLNGTISRLTYWPTRLPNETLQTITL